MDTVDLPRDAQHAFHLPRPSSQPAPRKRKSANHVRARPANPAVLTSIIDSLDGGALSPTSAPGQELRHERSMSPLAHEDGAPPPSIRTSRAPSGLSKYTAPSVNGTALSRLRPISINSRSSSFSTISTTSRDREGNARNKHSAESWIKQGASGEDRGSESPSGERRRSLRRVSPQEALKSGAGEDSRQPLRVPADPWALSRAEQIIARTPPPATDPNKGRLYLGDASPGDSKPLRDSLISNTKSADTEVSLESSQPTQRSLSTDTPEQHITVPPRISPTKSPIVDSIPMRTSSLRATSSSPVSTQRREKKSKRRPSADTVAENATVQSQTIPESSWADLGENDETVRRIRELREKRKSRIEEQASADLMLTPTPEVPQIANHAAESTAPSAAATNNEEFHEPQPRRRAPNRAPTEPPLKAHRILGLTTDVPNRDISPAQSRRPSSRNQMVIDSPRARPGGISPGTPPLSLDYSYARAVDALQGANQELERRRVHSRQPSQNSVSLSVVDSPRPPRLAESSVPSSPARSRSTRKHPDVPYRWTAHHPDLPLELDRRKSRRKSMSDARRTRHIDEDLVLQRRASVEDAVMQYLQAPRLSRRIKSSSGNRTISFSEVGDPDGAAVFVCVGMGLTRYVTAFYDELASTLRLRLITVERPGVGASDPYPPNERAGPLSWPDDVLAICHHLGITKFSLLAHSAGAIYALSTALILPHLVNGKVHLLAPWIPPSQLGSWSHPTASAAPAGALPRGQRILRVLPTSLLKAANTSFMTATSASLKPATRRQIQAAQERSREHPAPPSPEPTPPRPSTSHRPDYNRRESLMLMDQFKPTTTPLDGFALSPTPDNDSDLPTTPKRLSAVYLSATASPCDPTFDFAQTALRAAEHAEQERKTRYTSLLTERTWELATRDSNPATDLLVCLERNREIGFRYTDVTRAVVITHGSEDKRVPLANVKWLAEQMNARAAATVVGGTNGHSRGSGYPQSREGWVDEASSRGGCEVRVLQGEDHGLMASAPIMSDILTEIAGYWVGQERGKATTG